MTSRAFKKMKDLLKYLFPLVLGFAIGFFVRPHKNAPESKVIVQVDTCVVVDTIVREKPVPQYVKVIRRDTLRTEYWHLQHDTVVAEVPIERKVYEEDSLYRCEISGYNAQLEYLMIYPTTTTITIREKTPCKKWGFGVTTGASVLATPSGSVHAGIGATVGVSFRF